MTDKKHILIVSDSVQTLLIKGLRSELGESYLLDEELVESWKKEFILLNNKVDLAVRYHAVVFIPSLFRLSGQHYSRQSSIDIEKFTTDFLELSNLFNAREKLLLKAPFNFAFNISMSKVITKIFQGIQSNSDSIELIELNGLNTKVQSDLRLWSTASIELHPEYSEVLSRSISRTLRDKWRTIKCIVFDLDNTIWSGLAGEQTISEIEIKGGAYGKCYWNIQQWIKWHKDKGVVLAICSKNNNDIAVDIFNNHPDMILVMSDIATKRINWENKHENIQSISEELNIGLDQILFLDDQKFEREQVKAFLPSVYVPELFEDPADILSVLWGLDIVNKTHNTREDKIRTTMYQEEQERKHFSSSFSSHNDFLKSLGMLAEIEPLSDLNIIRAEQLSFRTNQFNFRTVRYSRSDLERQINDPKYISFLINLKDKFGNYGSVVFVVLHISEQELFIENWVMSCRVFKRTLEFFTFNEIARLAVDRSFSKLVCERIPTEKNVYVKELPGELGFLKDDGLWVLDLPHEGLFQSTIRKTNHDKG